MLQPLSKKLFDIYALFTREPFVHYFTEELEFYSNGNGELVGLISVDLTDKDFYACILSRDESMQFRAEKVTGNLETIQEAREWLQKSFYENSITSHDNKHKYFDIFKELDNSDKIHPHFKLLRDSESMLSAKEVMKEISYHYKDIDGNFIDQLQSLNGFDSRVFELYLFCFFREQYFSFKREYEAPDFMIEKLGESIAVEAVTISRKPENLSNIEDYTPKEKVEIDGKLENEVPLMFGSALFDKAKKKYWEKPHVRDKPFIIAIADFHDTMSMTWSYNSLVEYLYGYTYNHHFSESGELIVKPVKIEDFEKPNGTRIPAGFFSDPHNQNISAVLFSSTATLSKFNRIGKQAGLGSPKNILVRNVILYNHEKNADEPIIKRYVVDENSNENWSEGVIVYHNPNAIHPVDPELFDDRIAQSFFDLEEKLVISIMSDIFPYSSLTENLIFKEKDKEIS